MKFSIITPTLQRESLIRCSESLDSQSYQDWEHIVVIDALDINRDITRRLRVEQRWIVCFGRRFANFGNTPRHLAWKLTTGDYCLYLDDDNYLTDEWCLENIAEALNAAGSPPFVTFPILRFGVPFHIHPPGVCQTDSANMVIRRDIAQWPDIPDYTADGILAARLYAEHGCIPMATPPIITVPVQSKGE